MLSMKGAMAIHEPSDAMLLAAFTATNQVGSVRVYDDTARCGSDPDVGVSLAPSHSFAPSQSFVYVFLACMCTAQSSLAACPFMMSPKLRSHVAA
jgi:hypothetical protein